MCRMCDAIQVAVGELYAIKAAPDRVIRAENALNTKLVELFSQVEKKVYRELMQRGVPNNPQSLRLIMKPMESAVEDYFATIWPDIEAMATYGRNQAVADSQKRGISVSFQQAPTLSSTALSRLREQTFVASQATLRRLTGNVMQQLADDFGKGLGIDEMAQDLKNVFQGMKDYELRRVARTEVNSAQSFGANETMMNLSNVDYHMWWTAGDDRVRDYHADMHGQIVKVGEPFSNGLYYPGDKSGPLEEWINCRCRAVPFIIPEGLKVPPGQNWFYEGDLR